MVSSQLDSCYPHRIHVSILIYIPSILFTTSNYLVVQFADRFLAADYVFVAVPIVVAVLIVVVVVAVAAVVVATAVVIFALVVKYLDVQNQLAGQQCQQYCHPPNL